MGSSFELQRGQKQTIANDYFFTLEGSTTAGV
jgi:hypothetical protein